MSGSVEQDPNAARRHAILEAAVGVFARFGFKKTSMEDLARAAGLSRQGLYLHFSTKDLLFQATVLHLIEVTRAAGQAALRQPGAVHQRILGAFHALHGETLGTLGAEHLNELLSTAEAVAGPAMVELEEGILSEVTKLLKSSGIAAHWKALGVSPRQLADHLHAASAGLKHHAKTPSEYLEGMKVAVKIVCARAPEE